MGPDHEHPKESSAPSSTKTPCWREGRWRSCSQLQDSQPLLGTSLTSKESGRSMDHRGTIFRTASAPKAKTASTLIRDHHLVGTPSTGVSTCHMQ